MPDRAPVVRLIVVAVAVALAPGCAPSDDAARNTTADTGSVAVVAESTVTQPAPAPATTTAAGDASTKAVVTRSAVAVGDGVRPTGFTTITAAVTSVDGAVCNVCLWMADTADERSQGLMGVTDLGEAVGMAFAWDEPTTGRFFMFDTPAPLSIAFFDAAGAYVSEADMEPCLTSDAASCARYSAAGEFVAAIEMLQGELDAIGIGPGSSLRLLAGTESAGCAAVG